MGVELPDLRQVRAFAAVAETESFTKAAKKLFLTQSAVSHSIRGLEAHLGTKLVERQGKRISLTQDGVVFLRRCRRALQELETATRELDALNRWGQGRIRIGATHTLCHYLLPAVLREFRDCFPRCEIHIESGDTATLMNLLDEARIDLALGIGSRVPAWCEMKPIFEDRLVFIVSPRHRWAEMKDIPLDEVGDESFLVYARQSETYRLIREHFEQVGVRLRATLSLGDMEAIKEMAKLGIGVGIVAPWVARRELESGQLVALPIRDAPLQRKWGVFHHASKTLAPVEEKLVGICERTARGFATAREPGEAVAEK
ncbi:MAG: LysR family transcriptional regulator [Akkermansiaceae bacterium]|nr:LysR family transcriptional regulator [Akkermansiaceae bacterium]NNM27944.1 LysR family transcriptional regulator [Akkermansiaceae bacterium]